MLPVLMKLKPIRSVLRTQLVRTGSPLVGFSFGDCKMKRIKLTQNKYALVDDADYDSLSKFKWYANKLGHTWYAYRNTPRNINGKHKTICMHRQILGLKRGDGLQADHKNHYGLDNRRSNLRTCNHQQNDFNRRKVKGSSQFKGVYWHKARMKWIARIKYNNEQRHLGYFDNELEAAKAYDTRALELFGEFAYLNFSETM